MSRIFWDSRALGIQNGNSLLARCESRLAFINPVDSRKTHGIWCSVLFSLNHTAWCMMPSMSTTRKLLFSKDYGLSPTNASVATTFRWIPLSSQKLIFPFFVVEKVWIDRNLQENGTFFFASKQILPISRPSSKNKIKEIHRNINTEKLNFIRFLGELNLLELTQFMGRSILNRPHKESGFQTSPTGGKRTNSILCKSCSSAPAYFI